MKIKIIISFVLIILISSCSKGNKLEEKADSFADNVGSEFLTKDENISDSKPKDNWWLEFNDVVLNQLIDLGLKNNKDIQIADLAIITSRQLNNIIASSLLPSFSANLGRQRFASPGFGPNGIEYDIYQTTFDAAWELDFLGKNLDRYKAGKLRFLEEVQLYKAATIRIAAEIAQNYIKLKSSQKQIEDLEEITDIRKKLVAIASQQEKEGRSSKVNIYDAQIELNSSLNQLSEVRVSEKVLTYKLAVLVGKTPEEILGILDKKSSKNNQKEIFDYYSGIVPVGLKSDIIRRRPDIIAAEYEINAALFDKKAQFKEFFPSFTLTAKIGGGDRDLGEVLKNGTNVKDIRGGISIPIFQAGKLIAEYKISKAEAKIAVLNYEKTILSALEECESQLARYINALQIENNSDNALQAAVKILQINENKKNSGVISTEELLKSQIAVLNSQNQAAQKKSDSLVNLIALHKAIGGGFEGYEMRFEKDRIFWEEKTDNQNQN